MRFLWPEMLWLFLGMPALIGIYFVLLRIPVKRAPIYPAIELFGTRADATYRLRTHVPAALLLAAICAFLTAAARPVIGSARHLEARTVIVMIDASYSMGAADVTPTRLHVAKQAAKALLEWQPRDVLVGVVAFGNHAYLVQPPTPDRNAVRRALDKLDMQPGSALGTGLLGSLMTLFPEHDLAGGYDVFGHHLPRFAYPSLDRVQETARPAPIQRVPPADSELARIVVLSDGQTTHGVPLDVALALAAKHNVQLLVVGIGSSSGGTVEVAGHHYRVGFDEHNLIAMASGRNSAYWRVTNLADLERALPSIQSAAVYDPRVAEVSVYFAALGVCLVLAAAFTSARPRLRLPGKRVGTT